MRHVLLTVAILFSCSAFAIDKIQTVNQIKQALAQSNLSPEQKVQHALNRLGYGANPVSFGVNDLLKKKTVAGKLVDDPVATDAAIAEWVWDNLVRVRIPDPSADAQVRNIVIPIPSPTGTFNLTTQTPGSTLMNKHYEWWDYTRLSDISEDDRMAAGRAMVRLRTSLVALERYKKVARALVAKYPLGEALDDFWFNHFNVGQLVQGQLSELTRYKQAIRNASAGHFVHMLRATAYSPAMLIYLDNYKNRRPMGNVGINENYAREIMELHTLGQGPNLGTYTQGDVFQAARILTGLTITGQNRLGVAVSRFCSPCHDPGVKSVMGQNFPEGEAGIAAFLNFLSRHPQTARNISKKLVNRFAIEANGSNAQVEATRRALENKLTAAFNENNGHLTQVYVALFGAKEFWSQAAYQNKVKQPFEWLVSAHRAAGIGSPLNEALLSKISTEVDRMGQPLFNYPFPTGYKDINAIWASTNGISSAVSRSIATAQGHQASVISKSGIKLGGAGLESYFRIHNRVSHEVCFQNDYGKTSGPDICGWVWTGQTDGGYYACRPGDAYLPDHQMRLLGTSMITQNVFDFESILPLNAPAKAALTLSMAEKADRVGGIAQPVKSQLALLLASPRFLKR